MPVPDSRWESWRGLMALKRRDLPVLLDHRSRFVAGPTFGKVAYLLSVGCTRVKERPRDLGWPDWAEGAYVRVRHMSKFDAALVIQDLRDFCVARLAAEIDGRVDTWLFMPKAVLDAAARVPLGEGYFDAD